MRSISVSVNGRALRTVRVRRGQTLVTVAVKRAGTAQRVRAQVAFDASAHTAARTPAGDHPALRAGLRAPVGHGLSPSHLRGEGHGPAVPPGAAGRPASGLVQGRDDQRGDALAAADEADALAGRGLDVDRAGDAQARRRARRGSRRGAGRASAAPSPPWRRRG